MQMQTLSIVVPAGCPNDCKFCVSKLHDQDEYINQIENNIRFKDLYREDYIKRLSFARDNGCNTMIFTGNGEPLLNQSFLEFTAICNKELSTPFRWIELQTSGVTLNDEKLRWLRNMIGVTTISLSLSSIFDSKKNADYNGTIEKLIVDIDSLCSEIKRYDFNLRLSLNMTDFYNEYEPREIFKRAKDLNADQVTFRVLYKSNNPQTEKEKEINSWIDAHSCNQKIIDSIKKYVIDKGRGLEKLPFGFTKYSVDGISTVIDDDCMSTEVKDILKYLILRPNCKLYSKWDDPGSLMF